MITGTYNDGRQAKSVPAIAAFSDRHLTITDPETGGVYAEWSLADIHLVGNPADGQSARLRHGNDDDRFTLAPDAPIIVFKQRCPNLWRLNHHEGSKGRTSLILWAGGAVVSVLLLIFVIIPQVAEIIAHRVPAEWEERLGRSSADQILSLLSRLEGKSGKDIGCDAPKANAALRRLTDRLAPSSGIEVRVVDLDMANAFAIPGNRVFLLRGLIDEAESPDEVVGVLAHEIGHVIHRHPLAALIRGSGTAILFGLILGDVFGGSVIAGLGETAISGAYSRDAETEADTWAIEQANASGIDIRPLAQFFLRLDIEQGDIEKALKYFSTHPQSKERAARILEQAAPGRPALTDAEWRALQTMCD